jgi:hypothetical protein
MAVLRWAGVVAAVVAAMALGRVVTDLASEENSADDPFVVHGEVGETVELEYADVTVTDVRSARSVSNVDMPAQATGRFLLLDLEVTSTQEFTTFLGSWVVDRSGRRFVADHRSADCPQNISPLVGVPWRATYCFDLSRDAFEDATLVFARSDYGVNGSDVRRDHVAEIDLGIDADEAAALWESEEQVELVTDGPLAAAP